MASCRSLSAEISVVAYQAWLRCGSLTPGQLQFCHQLAHLAQHGVDKDSLAPCAKTSGIARFSERRGMAAAQRSCGSGERDRHAKLKVEFY